MVPEATAEKTRIKPVRSAPAVKTPKERTKVSDTETPFKGRITLSENYEKPVSSREDWWRSQIRETPVPGAYEIRDFLVDFEERPATYTFKSEGRRKDAGNQRRGAVLLPGAYDSHDLIYDLERTRYTYSMINTSREENEVLGVKDKGCNVCPTRYPMEKHLSLTCQKMPSKHPMFKSASQRFPTIYFQGTKNPSPERYQSYTPDPMHVVSSSFKCKTPRFTTAHTKVPGPGSYEKTFQSPMPTTVARMGRNHGLFFTSAFSL